MRNLIEETYINNQNQEAFIKIVINYGLRSFFSVLATQNIIFTKISILRIK